MRMPELPKYSDDGGKVVEGQGRIRARNGLNWQGSVMVGRSGAQCQQCHFPSLDLNLQNSWLISMEPIGDHMAYWEANKKCKNKCFTHHLLVPPELIPPEQVANWPLVNFHAVV